MPNYADPEYALNNLSIEFQTFSRKARNLALSNPKKYGEVQDKLSESLRSVTAKNLYKIVYEFLKKGNIPSAAGAFNSIDTIVGDIALGPIGYPEERLVQIALNLTETVDKELDKLILLAFPDPLSGLAEKSIMTKQTMNAAAAPAAAV